MNSLPHLFHISEFNDNMDTPLIAKYEYLVESINKLTLRAQNPHNKPLFSPHVVHNIHLSKTPAYWWNPECQFALIARSKATKTFKQSPSIENLIELKRNEAVAKRTFKKAKRNAWKKFCSGVNPNTPVSKVWKFVKSFKNRYLNSFSSPNLSQNFISKDIASNLISSICPPCYLCPPILPMPLPEPSLTFPFIQFIHLIFEN